jgi:hypothetical protein
VVIGAKLVQKAGQIVENYQKLGRKIVHNPNRIEIEIGVISTYMHFKYIIKYLK